MKWPTINRTRAAAIGATFAVSWAIAALGGDKFKVALDSVSTVGVPMLVGLIFAVVGIYVSILLSVYSTLVGLANARADVNKVKLIEQIDRFYESAEEAKENALFLISFMALGLAIPLLRLIDIPEHWWPLKPDWLTVPSFLVWGNSILSTLMLATLILAFWAIVDTIGAIFRSNAIMATISREMIRTASPARFITVQLDADKAETPDAPAAPTDTQQVDNN